MAPFVPGAAFKGIGPCECPDGSRYAVGRIWDLCLLPGKAALVQMFT